MGAFLFIRTKLRKILCHIAQEPLNVPLISAWRESLAFNQSHCSLHLSQICLLVSLQCQIEFSWTVTLLLHSRLCDPKPCAKVSECVSSNHVLKSQLPLIMIMDEWSCHHLDCCCWLSEGMLHWWHLQETTQHNLSFTIAVPGLFAVTLIQLHCPYIISGHLFWRDGNLKQGQYKDKHEQQRQKFSSSTEIRLLSLYGAGHPTENSKDDSHDNVNVRGDDQNASNIGW